MVYPRPSSKWPHQTALPSYRPWADSRLGSFTLSQLSRHLETKQARGLPEDLTKMDQSDITAFIQTMGRQQARQLHIVPTKTTFRNLTSTWSTGRSHQYGPARQLHSYGQTAGYRQLHISRTKKTFRNFASKDCVHNRETTSKSFPSREIKIDLLVKLWKKADQTIFLSVY